jgi:hypothetical protein
MLPAQRRERQRAGRFSKRDDVMMKGSQNRTKRKTGGATTLARAAPDLDTPDAARIMVEA